MKKQSKFLFENLFGRKSKQLKEESLDVVISQYSQPHVLQQRMKEANLTHGQTVKADITTVRLEQNFGKMVLYFCPSQTVVVNERITDGDGGKIPSEVTLIGFEEKVPKTMKPGLYDLKNAKLFSNGTMQVIADENTVFEFIEPDIPF